MKKVLVITGPTATGKTSLALKLAEEFDGEIISADSRQVYKYFNIVTGKDIPKNFRLEDDYYTDGNVRIWGYDIVNPEEDFSAKLYADYAREVIANIHSRGKLPIIEGGTGFYIDAAVKNFEHINIPKNKKLREKYSILSTDELYKIFMKIDPQKAISLKRSDRKNKRRLLRILEKADFEIRGYVLEESSQEDLYDLLWIGLNYKAREELYLQIGKRVESRLGEKLEEEIKLLKSENYFEKAQETTPGYKHWNDPDKWKQAEKQYAKRQITWFKRNKNIKWLDADDGDLPNKAGKLVENFLA